MTSIAFDEAAHCLSPKKQRALKIMDARMAMAGKLLDLLSFRLIKPTAAADTANSDRKIQGRPKTVARAGIQKYKRIDRSNRRALKRISPRSSFQNPRVQSNNERKKGMKIP
jgi:hypothetical protein